MTDLALQWMSFRGSGNLADLASTLTGGANARRFVDDLVTLGHAEWTRPGSWRIAPPVLAGLPKDRGAAAVLCGARTPKLLANLSQAFSGGGGSVGTLHHGDRPSTITVTAPSEEDLAAIAARMGIPLQSNAAVRMLACTPSIREWPRTPYQMVQGRVETVRRFSRSKMHWVAATLEEASSANAGLFRIQRDWDWITLIKSGAEGAALIDDRAGRIAAAAKCKVVRWSHENGMLSLPAQLYPPGTMARGLALCSGELPSFDRESRQIAFAGVGLEHLRLILALTHLRLA